MAIINHYGQTDKIFGQFGNLQARLERLDDEAARLILSFNDRNQRAEIEVYDGDNQHVGTLYNNKNCEYAWVPNLDYSNVGSDE